jgi:hypothetical protein
MPPHVGSPVARSSTVDTLFLAYAGTSLPLLLLFVSAQQGFAGIITRELVATEVVRTLVDSIGLVASAPISTWLAPVCVERQRQTGNVKASIRQVRDRRGRCGVASSVDESAGNYRASANDR